MSHRMWNYVISLFQFGVTVVAFDGSPLAPPSVLWEHIDNFGITRVGISYVQSFLGEEIWRIFCRQTSISSSFVNARISS